MWSTEVKRLADPADPYWSQRYGRPVTAISDPKVTPMNIGGTNFVLALYRVSVDNNYWPEKIGLSAIRAEAYHSTGLADLKNWMMVRPELIRTKPDDRGEFVADPSMVGINGKLFVIWNGRELTESGELRDVAKYRVYGFPDGSPTNIQLLQEGDLLSAVGFKGSRVAAKAVTRVTSGAPGSSPTSPYFDSSIGRLVISYECRTSDADDCNDQNILNGAYLQEFVLDPSNQPVFCDTPIQLYTHPATALSGEPWVKQNVMVSGVGYNTAVIAMNYNVVGDAGSYHARDYPTYTSFFLLKNVDAVLSKAWQVSPIHDISAQMPDHNGWRGRVAGNYALMIASNSYDWTNATTVGARSTWDQGAMWSAVVYLDPHTGDLQTFYEAWGAVSDQPTKHDTYPQYPMGPHAAYRVARRPVYSVKPGHAVGNVVDVFGAGMPNGTKAVQWRDLLGDNQRFFLEPMGRLAPSRVTITANEYYRLRAVHSRRCLDVYAFSVVNGGDVVQWDCTSGDNQSVKVVPVESEYYLLSFKHSQKVMDVAGGLTTDGAKIWQWEWLGGSNQRFVIAADGYR